MIMTFLPSFLLFEHFLSLGCTWCGAEVNISFCEAHWPYTICDSEITYTAALKGCNPGPAQPMHFVAKEKTGSHCAIFDPLLCAAAILKQLIQILSTHVFDNLFMLLRLCL